MQYLLLTVLCISVSVADVSISLSLELDTAVRGPFHMYPTDGASRSGNNLSESLLCPKVPEPPRSVDSKPFYIDEKSSIIDSKLLEADKIEEAKIRNFTRQLGNMTTAFTLSHRKELSKCGLEWLDRWAHAGALLGNVQKQGLNYRIWALVPISQSYIVLSMSDLATYQERERIHEWISNLAVLNENFLISSKMQNNMSYWASAGFALSSIVLNNKNLLQLAVAIAEKGIDSITEDGFFPGEIRRGRRALEYHGFALGPLAITAEIAFANGIDLFSRNKNALERVGRNLIESENDTKIFDLKSGVKQDAAVPLSKGNFAWLEIINKHSNSTDIKLSTEKHRPLVYDRMGGNITILYGGYVNKHK